MRYLLDTNVFSEPRRGQRRANPAVVAWLKRTPQDETAISIVTVFETTRGILKLQRHDPIQAGHLQSWFDHSLGAFHRRVLGIDTAVMVAAARLHTPDPRPAWDSLIAATALVHGLTVVTRNTQDFEAMGVPLINPWEY